MRLISPSQFSHFSLKKWAPALDGIAFAAMYLSEMASAPAPHSQRPQPALSRAIKELEHDLGSEVLERSRQFVRLTPAGAVLLQETTQLLDGWEEALRRVMESHLTRKQQEALLEELERIETGES